MTGGCAEASGENSVRASRGKQQHDQEQNGEGGQSGGKSWAAITVPQSTKNADEGQDGPQAEDGKQAELARGSQTRIVT